MEYFGKCLFTGITGDTTLFDIDTDDSHLPNSTPTYGRSSGKRFLNLMLTSVTTYGRIGPYISKPSKSAGSAPPPPLLEITSSILRIMTAVSDAL